MVRKVKATGSDNSSQFAAAVRDSATQIWVTGMGAIAKVQQEGTKVLDALVHDGTILQQRALRVGQRTAKQVEGRLTRVASEVEGRLTRVASQVQKRANVARDRVEVAIEERLQSALGRLGGRTATVNDLTKRVEELTVAVKKLSGEHRPAAKRARKTAASA